MDADSTLVLSVNNRHARRIVSELSATLGASQKVMAVPDIVPLPAWLMQIADHLSFQADQDVPSHIADGFGALYVWRRVISDIESDNVLLDTAQAARLACEADRLLDDWRIVVRPDEETADYQRLLVWRSRYREYLRERDAEDSNLSYERVCHAIADGHIQLPVQNVVLAGFNDVSPRLAALLDALRDRGVDLFMLEQTGQPARHVYRVKARDRYAEWCVAAQWVSEQLRHHPQGRYAIVAPQLEGSVPLAHRVLHQTLGPQDFAFNIAVGRPLSQWPLARAALAWLHVMACYARGQPCRVQDLGAALLSGGCIAHRDEASGRALLDARLRRRELIELSPAQFSVLLDDYAPQLAVAWREGMELIGVNTGNQTPTFWAELIRTFLQSLGFPGYAPLDSHAYQTLEAFDQLLDRLARQTPVLSVLSFGAVVSVLRQLAHETIFQPQRDPRSVVDVLGFLEAEGGRWDGVWVLGLTDEILPASPQPNPLVPLSAMRRVNAPRATPERELQWAQSIYRSLLASAPQVWFSHPEYDGERQLRPSPCITDIPEQYAEPVSEPPSVWPLDYVTDEQGPPVQHDDSIRGGVALIDTQARNPLWAFAKFRLGASVLPDYATLSAQRVRGQFLHYAMELFWRMVPDQQSLKEAARTGRLDALIEQVTAQAADEWLSEYSPSLRELEVQRACDVLSRWLQLEMQREPFLVRAVEQRERWSHGNLELVVRLDRIDTLADGRLGVMDYKSGASKAKLHQSWLRERPVDIQLPFYAAMLNQNDTVVAALVLAHLHARTTECIGISDGDYGLAGVVHYTSWEALDGLVWEQVLQRWQHAITELADEFARGHAANDSVDPADLMFCDVLPFLRLTEEVSGRVKTAE